VAGRIQLLTYGCAYIRQTTSTNDRTNISSSTSSNDAIVQQDLSECQSVTASISPLSVLLAGINDSDYRGISLDSDVTGLLCHCARDNCNLAVTVRFRSWLPAVIWTTAILVIMF